MYSRMPKQSKCFHGSRQRETWCLVCYFYAYLMHVSLPPRTTFTLSHCRHSSFVDEFDGQTLSRSRLLTDYEGNALLSKRGWPSATTHRRWIRCNSKRQDGPELLVAMEIRAVLHRFHRRWLALAQSWCSVSRFLATTHTWLSTCHYTPV